MTAPADEPLGQRAESVINELLGWLTGPDSGQNDGLTDAVALIQEALAANADLTARVEAAEKERDALREEWVEIAAGITSEQPEVGALWPLVSEVNGSLAASRNLLKNEIAAHNTTKAQRDAALARATAAEAQAGRLRELVERARHCMPALYEAWHVQAQTDLAVFAASETGASA